MTVGTSSRTPFKHWILNSQLGRICGVLSTGKVHALACPLHIIDLCAGDGRTSDDSRHSSPEIIERHGRWCLRRNMAVKATLIERAPQTFESLCQNTVDLPWIQKLNIDAREYKFTPTHKHQAVFIHADPNTIADWPVTRPLLDAMSETTTMLATLGCNVGGLKRLPVEQRLCWYDHVRDCLDAMPDYHDMLLIELANDASQWAYMLRLPKAWAIETLDSLAAAGKKYTQHRLELCSYRLSPGEFRQMEDRLFLTKKERGVK